jgi:signal transduction histidine kinase
VVELLTAHWKVQNKWTDIFFAILDFVALGAFMFTYHIPYHQPAQMYLKTPIFMYFFLFITIQSLRVDTKYVIISGASAIVNWLVLFFYELIDTPGKITHDYVGHIFGHIHIGAELSKLLILALFTAVLAKGVKNSQKLRKQSIGYYVLTEERNKRKNLQLHFEKEKAEEANRAKSRFLDIISHELNTPLNGILGLTQLQMLKDPESKELKGIMSKGQILLSHVSRILRFTEVEVRSTADIGYNIDTREVLLEAMEFYKRSKLEHVNTYRSKLQNPLPASFDKGKVVDIIYELLSNADKNSHQSVICLDASFSEENHRQVLVIEVSDQGEGMSEEQILLALDLFSQTQEPNKRKEGGIGLGFPMIKQLAASMDAWIEIFSKESLGTTVYLKIPQHEG